MTSIEAAMPELPDTHRNLRRSRAGSRAYLDHKADIGAPHATDQDILQRVDGITVILLGAVGQAIAAGNEDFLKRNAWFIEVAEDLLADRPAKLDG